MFVCSSASSSVSFDSYTLIVPCISVGNVGQLAVDLLINSLRPGRVGYLHDPSLLPLVGNDAFDHTPQSGHLHTAAEVYSSSELKITVVQIRAPIAKGFQQQFCSRLLQWVKESRFSEVVVLTSSQAHERRDSQIRGPQFQFLLNPHSVKLYPHFTESLHWSGLEPRTQSESDTTTSPPATTLEESQIFLPGAGLAKKLYSVSSAVGLGLVTLIAFCSQGDNADDAKGLASYLDEWLKLRESRPGRGDTWQCPDSWSLMYGGPSPENLF